MLFSLSVCIMQYVLICHCLLRVTFGIVKGGYMNIKCSAFGLTSDLSARRK